MILSYFMVNIIDPDLWRLAKECQASNMMLAMGDGPQPFSQIESSFPELIS